jgi:hypothetical protein
MGNVHRAPRLRSDWLVQARTEVAAPLVRATRLLQQLGRQPQAKVRWRRRLGLGRGV